MIKQAKNLVFPEAVFFDWDGTLADTYAFLNEAHGFILKELGFPPFAEGEYKQYFGMPREILYPKIYKDKHEVAKAHFESFVRDNSHKIKPMIGAENLLTFLHGRGVRMGIVSNKKAMFIHKEVENFDWEGIFETLVGAGEAIMDKPSGAPLLYALEKARIQPNSKVWYVGDTENDLSCACEAGCASVYLRGHEPPEPLIEKYKPLLFVENCKELHQILVAI